MTVEAATYIQDLQALNPPSSDPRSQGDDHLRLIKQVLQNTFPNAGRAFPIPQAQSKSISYSIQKNDCGTLFVSTAGGAVTLTLPTASMTAADDGWSIDIVKTSTDVNPVFIIAGGGVTFNSGQYSVTQARRCIPGARTTAVWNGTSWFVTRTSALPPGTAIEFHGSALPVGYEWPNGQTLSSTANYPEYNAAMGGLGTIDKRGRVGLPLDNLGGTSAGRLSGGQITGTAVGNVGGTDTKTLVTGNLPPYTPSGSVSTSTTINNGTNIMQGGASSQGGGLVNGSTVLVNITASSSSSFSGNAQGGTSVPFGILQPSIMVTQILVVE